MTVIKAIYAPDIHTYILTAKGHATGSEVACASISALLNSLERWLLEEHDGVTLLMHIMEPGNVRICFFGGDAAKLAMDFTVGGLLLAEKAWPELIQVDVNVMDGSQ